MSSQYTCELCLKEFKQKIDYTRHKNKKNACVTADKLKTVVEQKISHDTTVKNMSTLFSACMNILRDNESLTGEKALRNLSYLLVLRLIEPMIGGEIDLESVEYPFPEVYRPKKDKFLKYTKFSNIAASKEDDIPTILGLIWDFILSNHPKTKDIFLRGKGFDMKKQATFRKLIDKLSEFDFSSVNVDVQGHAYEDLLKDIMIGKVLGQFFTQPLVKDLLLDLVNPRLFPNGKCETIFDPAMGTGGFLMSSLRHFQKQAEVREIKIDWDFICSGGIGGRETEPDTFQLCKTNMLMSCGHMLDNLQQGDSIRDPIKGKYDIVLANPPFGIKGLEYQEIKNHDGARDKYLPIESKSAVPLFLQAIISILKVGGRCAMVMPDGQELFGKGKALVALREYLMKTCDLKEIYYLPSGVFTNTTIKTCVVYFHKRREGSDVVEIGGKKTRTYKFSKTLQTESIKFYDYNPYEKVKNLLVEVDVRRIAENNYSLNYAEYLDSQEQNEEKEHNSDVEWKTLGELFKFNVGQLKAMKCDESGGYPVISSSDNHSHETFELEGENIFILKIFDGSKNKSYSTKIKYFNGKCNFTSLLYHMCPYNKNAIVIKYIYYYLNNNVDYISKTYQKGACNKSLDLDLFMKYKIPLPSLQAQQRIVERLDYLYEKCRETSRSLIDQFRSKKAMVVEMGIEGVETKPLGEVCIVNYGTRIVRKHNTEGEYPVYGSGRDMFTTENYNREDFNVLIGRFALSENCVRLTNHKLFLNDSGMTVKPKSQEITHKYLGYYLFCNQKIIYDCARGTAQKNMDIEKFNSLPIPIPSLRTQERIVQECERLDKLITDLEADIESDKSLASEFLNRAIKGRETEEEQEYTDVIISEEDLEEEEYEEEQYAEVIIKDDEESDE
jgi:type I restriction-modification system DNA methylase subunit/restriction endonuclease S subunit